MNDLKNKREVRDLIPNRRHGMGRFFLGSLFLCVALMCIQSLYLYIKNSSSFVIARNLTSLGEEYFSVSRGEEGFLNQTDVDQLTEKHSFDYIANQQIASIDSFIARGFNVKSGYQELNHNGIAISDYAIAEAMDNHDIYEDSNGSILYNHLPLDYTALIGKYYRLNDHYFEICAIYELGLKTENNLYDVASNTYLHQNIDQIYATPTSHYIQNTVIPEHQVININPGSESGLTLKFSSHETIMNIDFNLTKTLTQNTYYTSKIEKVGLQQSFPLGSIVTDFNSILLDGHTNPNDSFSTDNLKAIYVTLDLCRLLQNSNLEEYHMIRSVPNNPSDPLDTSFHYELRPSASLVQGQLIDVKFSLKLESAHHRTSIQYDDLIVRGLIIAPQLNTPVYGFLLNEELIGPIDEMVASQDLIIKTDSVSNLPRFIRDIQRTKQSIHYPQALEIREASILHRYDDILTYLILVVSPVLFIVFARFSFQTFSKRKDEENNYEINESPSLHQIHVILTFLFTTIVASIAVYKLIAYLNQQALLVLESPVTMIYLGLIEAIIVGVVCFVILLLVFSPLLRSLYRPKIHNDLDL